MHKCLPFDSATVASYSVFVRLDSIVIEYDSSTSNKVRLHPMILDNTAIVCESIISDGVQVHHTPLHCNWVWVSHAFLSSATLASECEPITHYIVVECISCKPPEKLLEDGFSTPMPLFCLICTIISNKTCILDEYQNTNFEWTWVDTDGRVRHPPYSKKFFVRWVRANYALYCCWWQLLQFSASQLCITLYIVVECNSCNWVRVNWQCNVHALTQLQFRIRLRLNVYYIIVEYNASHW